MNGAPHIGHAYEVVSADMLARLHRLLGFSTFFLTGADEHGQKVQRSAIEQGRTPQQHCDEYVALFKQLNARLGVSNDHYVRTTHESHKKTAQQMWLMCAQNNDIYLRDHEGYYNEREECFVTDLEAELTQFKDPVSLKPYKRVSEQAYFFAMSKYKDSIIKYIEQENVVQPETAKNELLARLLHPDPSFCLRDVCISRTSFSWGIPVPEGFDQKHIMYVWFDALSNYLTGVQALDGNSIWPADKHIIGKDITWFHCVIWIAMLMSAKLELPKQVFAHGFVNDADGRKMSKSLNNTVDPAIILAKYPVDSIRYYMLTAATYGSDVNFSEQALISSHNELADSLGNLVHRAFVLCTKYCQSAIPNTLHNQEFGLPFDLKSLIEQTPQLAESCSINVLLGLAMQAVRDTNKFLTHAEPWKMKHQDQAKRPAVIRTVLEAIYVCSHFLAPAMPFVTQKVFDKLGPCKRLQDLDCNFYNLVPGTILAQPHGILFPKLDVQAAQESGVKT